MQQIKNFKNQIIFNYNIFSGLNNLKLNATGLPKEIQIFDEKYSKQDDKLINVLKNIPWFSYRKDFSEIKEKSALKAECAVTLRKDRYAEEFSLADGAVANKDSIAIRNISEEILVEAIYELISSLFKVKLDETHRLVDTLKTVLMTRLSEAKLIQVDSQI